MIRKTNESKSRSTSSKRKDDSFLSKTISTNSKKKDNVKKPTARGRSRKTTRKGSLSAKRPGVGAVRSANRITSEHFLGHAQTPIDYDPIVDARKLIKKGEKPVKIVGLMGTEQVGQCILIEYENDMIMVDAGMEFAADDELGADYIVPDISYVKKNKKKLRGIVITHGHLDHVGALRDILPDLGRPVVYTTPLALGIIKKTFDDKKEAAKVKYKLIDPDQTLLKLGCFKVEFVRVNHNIPESMALAIHTPKGLIFDSGDFKVDHTPAIDKPADLAKISRIGAEGVKLYIGDSLGANIPGRAKSETEIGRNLDKLIKETKKRMIVVTFGSNVGRVIQFINSAVRYNRVVFLAGRSLINYVEIAKQLGYITVPEKYLRKLSDEVNTLPDERVFILSTGAQGEQFAGLTRMSRGEHPTVQLQKGDTVMMSSSTIPGNEVSRGKMIDNLVTKDLTVITNKDFDIHTSGHSFEDGHKLFLSLLKPQFFWPLMLTASFRYAHRKLAMDLGLSDSRILMPNENGQVIEMYDNVVLVGKDSLKLDTVLVDGKGKGHLSGEYVVKARHIMAENGIVSLIFKIDTKSKELVGNIQIESRGFVYSSEVKNIHTKIVEFARAKYNENRKRRMDVRSNLRKIKLDLAHYMNRVIGREPMVMPMYVYINRDPKAPDDYIAKEEAIVGMTLEEQGGYEE